MSARRTVAPLALVAMTLLTIAADAQLERVGIVTTLQGSATLTRVSAPQGIPLKPRDDVFVADRIVTGDNALARILLGGKAVVTVRERSALTISESARTATIDVATGKIALAVVKERMKPGEQIDIRTPNAVAGIRGTVVITEVSQATSQVGAPAGGFTTTITVLTGTIEVRQLDTLTRQPVGAGVFVTASQAIRITGAAPPRPVQSITTDARQRLGDDFKLSLKEAAPPSSSDQLQQATNALRPTTGSTTSGTQPTTTSSGSGGQATSSSSSGPSTTSGGSSTTVSTGSSGSQPSLVPSSPPSSGAGTVSGSDSSRGASPSVPVVATPTPSSLPSLTGTGALSGSGSSIVSGSDDGKNGDTKSSSNRGPSEDNLVQKDLKSLHKRRR